MISGLETFWKVQAMMGIPFWIGIFWRRATVAGAWAATLAAFFVALVASNVFAAVFDVNAFTAQYLPPSMVFDGELRLPVQMVAYLSVGLVTMIGVSLLTPRVDGARLDRLYRALHTPVDKREPTPRAAFEVPAGSLPVPGRKMIDHADFELRYPSSTSSTGFAVAWLWVAALIAGVFWLAAP